MSDTPVWYWNQKGKAQGPFTFDQLKSFVAKGDLRGHELVFKENSSEWKRASEWSELDALFEDDKSTFTKFIKLPEEERTVIRTDNKPPEDKWVLLIRIEEDREVRFKQKGPYPTDEIKRYLREGKVSHSDHIWKKGAPKWTLISDVPEFHANQLNVTKEVKKLLSEATQMPSMPEVSEPKVQPVAKLKVVSREESAAIQKVTQQIATPLAEPVVIKEPQRDVVYEIKKTTPPPVEVRKDVPRFEVKTETADRPAMIPVIPHLVPSGGSHGEKAARVESFGNMEAEVVGPAEDEIEAKPIPAVARKPLVDDETDISELSEVPVTRSARAEPAFEASEEPVDQISEDKFLGVESFENKSKETATPVIEPVSGVVAKIPLRVETSRGESKVEPRAEPRRPEISKAIAEDQEKVRGWLSKLSPALSFLLLVFMGVGIWATLKTKSPILSGDRPVPAQEVQAKAPEPKMPEPVMPLAAVPAKVEIKPAMPTLSESESEDEIFDQEVVEASEVEDRAPAKAKKSPGLKKEKDVASVKEMKEFKEAKDSKEVRETAELPNISSEPKSTSLKVNNKAGFFEVVGAFRKGELLEMKIDGNSGAILDLPALHQRLEVRATKNFVHRVFLGDLRIPKGSYQFSVKWGNSKSSKKLTWGGEKSQLESALVQHRKQISFDQQQERKKILKALKEFAVLLSKAETEAGKGNLKIVQKDASEKLPAEIKIVRLSRHELVYSDQWEKLANQWDRLQAMIKEGGRGPASVTEISKAKKAMSILESEIKNQSVADRKD